MSYDVRIAEGPLEALFDIRGETTAAQACLAAAGYAVPEQPNRAGGEGESVAFWVGPEHWLLRAPIDREVTLMARFETLVADRLATATRVSDAYAGFEIGGADADQVLAQGCPLDLDPRQAPPGLATFTDLFGVRGLLYKPFEADCYRILVDRSLGHAFGAWLRRAAGQDA